MTQSGILLALERATDHTEQATNLSDWSPPDMSVLSAGRARPPEMPADIFGSFWPVVTDLATGTGAPVDYVGISILAVAASLIGGKRRVRPYDTSDWQESCILWFAAVGDPSSNKSPALDAVTRPLRPIEGGYAEDHKEVVRAFETVKERADAERQAWRDKVKIAVKNGEVTPEKPQSAMEPEPPARRRLIIMDSTPEALAPILASNPTGTLHFRDELAGWFTSFDRYATGGREFWLEAYGGRPYTVDRKGSPHPIKIAFNGVSVLGGIQPEKLVDQVLSLPDDGLVARFLWAWPDPVKYRRPSRKADIQKLEEIYRRLDQLPFGRDQQGNPAAAVLPLTAGAADIFDAWIDESNALVTDAASLFKSFMGKSRGTVLRLALVTEYLAWAAGTGPEPTEVQPGSLVAAIKFFDEYAVPSAIRVFGDAAAPPVERHAAALARYIVRNKLNRLNSREVKRTTQLPTLRKADVLDEAIRHLIEADWLRPAPSRAGNTQGRQKKDYEVNPAVLGGDDDRLA